MKIGFRTTHRPKRQIELACYWTEVHPLAPEIEVLKTRRGMEARLSAMVPDPPHSEALYVGTIPEDDLEEYMDDIAYAVEIFLARTGYLYYTYCVGG